MRLPTVRRVIVPTYAHSVLRSCPNATEVRCIGGTAKELVSALRFSKCEVFEGYVDWTIPKIMEREYYAYCIIFVFIHFLILGLVMNAPALRKVEISRTPKATDPFQRRAEFPLISAVSPHLLNNQRTLTPCYI